MTPGGPTLSAPYATSSSGAIGLLTIPPASLCPLSPVPRVTARSKDASQPASLRVTFFPDPQALYFLLPLSPFPGATSNQPACLPCPPPLEEADYTGVWFVLFYCCAMDGSQSPWAHTGPLIPD
jgi:hypothetical protein